MLHVTDRDTSSPIGHRAGLPPFRLTRVTCPRVSDPLRCEDRALLRGPDSCPDRIRRSFAFAPSHSYATANRSPPPPKSISVPPHLHNWVRQDQIDRGERPGIATHESTELTKADKRIRQLEAEVEILCKAANLLGEEPPDPKGFTR